MTTALLFLILGTQPIEKFSVPMGNIEQVERSYPKVFPFGVFANGSDVLYQFDFQGNLVLKIQGGPESFQSIRAFHVSDDMIWIIDNASLSSFFYDRSGAFLFHDKEIFSNNIQHVEGDTYIISPAFMPEGTVELSPFLRSGNLDSRPYPRLLKTMQLKMTPKGVHEKKELRSFYKAPATLSRTNLSFKKIWAFKEGNTFTVINQVDNLKYEYSPLHLSQERQIPPERPYQPRVTPLNLPHFKGVDKPFEPKPFYENIADHRRDYTCYVYGSSTVDTIATIPFGYLVGYTVPKENCERGSLAIAQMNRDFRTQRVFLELDRYGMLMGAHDDKVYVLVPNFKIDNVLIVGADPEIWVFDLNQ